MIPLVYHASYSRLALPPKHRFPISKYAHLYHYLLNSGLASEQQFISPKPTHAAELERVHDAGYVQAFIQGTLDAKAIRRLGFPWSQHLVTRTLHSVAGTALCARRALDQGIALHLAGGYHHAHHDFGSGYCVFNDLVFAARQLLDSGEVDKVMIIDCDVHQGDGTATLTAGDRDIVSCSFHCDANFPARKPQSDYDIALAPGTGDNEYLDSVNTTVNYLLELEKPDIILYDAGVDIHADDALGLLSVSLQGLYLRDLSLLTQAKQRGIPLAAVIGGGYSPDPLQLTQRHSQLFLAANHLWP
ncbi:histone deacetylase [Shewanella cyperi]|uniref:Histone deacetylase n=1 Tax=Shewanella cyperi TaxID=2814292 RepID=A0A974XMP4_9GAMM|nr:histone deacetylase [Shewanella cyperi]QSX31250.1 histone deacetylase [Shewanella cyperi]